MTPIIIERTMEKEIKKRDTPGIGTKRGAGASFDKATQGLKMYQTRIRSPLVASVKLR